MLYAALAAAGGTSLDTRTAFTTVAVVALVTHPANMVMTMVPRALASLACFERIQAYLLEPSREDRRGEIGPSSEDAEGTNGARGAASATRGQASCQRATRRRAVSTDTRPPRGS